MGTWSSTEPTLPAGSSWSAYTAATTSTQNHYSHTLSIRVARLQGRQVCIGVKYVQANGSYGDWYPSGSATLTPRVGSTNEQTTTLSASKSTRYRYYTTEADAGVTLRITALFGTSLNRTITAPALLPAGARASVYTGGAWKEADGTETFSGAWKSAEAAEYSGGWKGET